MTPRPAKLLLTFRGIQQKRVAQAYGASLPYVHDVLMGRKAPSPRLRALIVEMLELDDNVVWPEFSSPKKEKDPATNGVLK
jgi:hypothetical protein